MKLQMQKINMIIKGRRMKDKLKDQDRQINIPICKIYKTDN